ncbi:MAG: hypothetical protein HYV14_13490 [Elusimicrobia bacterium]|nr:hypothetical protein [Elusimicrobiota bacterium]
MDIQPLLLAYTAAALVALGVTAAFSASIEQTLIRLLPEGVAIHWAKFIKFGVFAVSFTGGLPAPLGGGFIDRNAPPGPPPGVAEGLMIVMNSASGALMAAAWVLLAFFGTTLMALIAGRAYQALRKYREEQAAEVSRREADRKEDKARQESQPVKRKEPAEARPVVQEKPGAHSPPRR